MWQLEFQGIQGAERKKQLFLDFRKFSQKMYGCWFLPWINPEQIFIETYYALDPGYRDTVISKMYLSS